MEPILGVIYDFNRDELFTGIVGVGAWLNGSKIKVGEVKGKSSAVLCTGFPVSTNFSSEAVLEFVDHVRKYKKIRSIGTAGLSLAYVASGRTDVYMEIYIKIWDVAAGIALVKSAGGKIHCEITEKENALNVRCGNKYLI